MDKLLAGSVTIAAAMGLILAPAAHADSGTTMYRVGSDIQPGTYKHTVTGNDMGAWYLCNQANCDGDGIITMDTVDGQGHTGYTTSAKYVKQYYLTLTPIN